MTELKIFRKNAPVHACNLGPQYLLCPEYISLAYEIVTNFRATRLYCPKTPKFKVKNRIWQLLKKAISGNTLKTGNSAKSALPDVHFTKIAKNHQFKYYFGIYLKFLAKHYLVTLCKPEMAQYRRYQMYSSRKQPKIVNFNVIFGVFEQFSANHYLVALKFVTISYVYRLMSVIQLKTQIFLKATNFGE